MPTPPATNVTSISAFSIAAGAASLGCSWPLGFEADCVDRGVHHGFIDDPRNLIGKVVVLADVDCFVAHFFDGAVVLPRSMC